MWSSLDGGRCMTSRRNKQRQDRRIRQKFELQWEQARTAAIKKSSNGAFPPGAEQLAAEEVLRAATELHDVGHASLSEEPTRIYYHNVDDIEAIEFEGPPFMLVGHPPALAEWLAMLHLRYPHTSPSIG